MAGTSISKVWTFFKEIYTGNGGLTQFRKEWEQLTETDKNQIRDGIEDGSMTY